MNVVGVDACPGGWVAVAIDDHGFVAGVVARSIAEVAAYATTAWGTTTIAVDIPIGIPTSGARLADVQTRRYVHPRGSSVFSTPVRAALESPTYAAACAASIVVSGKSLSAQAYAIRGKILDVDRFARPAGIDLREGHPEASFRAMATGPVTEPKHTFDGATLRFELLRSQGIDITRDQRDALKPAGTDDVLDAAAMAWTARRIATGEAFSLPDPPELMPDGIRAAIWV